MDLLGSMRTKSLGQRSYALGIVYEFTTHSEVYLISHLGHVFKTVCECMERSERRTGLRLHYIRLEGAGEHKGELVYDMKHIKGIKLERSPNYALQGNGRVEIFMKELPVRARLILNGTGLPDALWAEAINHGNWLPNRLPSKRISNKFSLRLWIPNANIINFFKLPTFSQPGFAFSYIPSMAANKKLSARDLQVSFVGM